MTDSDPALQATVVSKAQLLRIQKGLLDMSNHAAGLRGGWLTTVEPEYWSKACDSFQAADALIRDLMCQCEEGSEGGTEIDE